LVAFGNDLGDQRVGKEWNPGHGKHCLNRCITFEPSVTRPVGSDGDIVT
jgi:hypothetical protein